MYSMIQNILENVHTQNKKILICNIQYKLLYVCKLHVVSIFLWFSGSEYVELSVC